MLTKFKSTIIKQRGNRKAAKQEAWAGGGDGLVHLPLIQLHHPLIQLLISAGGTEDSRPVQFV